MGAVCETAWVAADAFGLPELRPEQLEAMEAAAGHDVLAVAWEAVESGGARYLFPSPEQLARDDVVERVAAVAPALFVVDEASRVSEWGRDSRPDYLRLADVVERLGHPPVVALTATAAPPVRADIVERLDLRDPREVTAGFDRPNRTWPPSCTPTRTAASPRSWSGSSSSTTTRATCTRSASSPRAVLTAPEEGPARPAEPGRCSGISARRRTAAVNLLEQAGALIVDGDGRVAATGTDRAEAVERAGEVARRRGTVRSRIDMMRVYAETTDCRRRLLLGYFGEHREPCGRCDNCDTGRFGSGVVMSAEDDRVTVLFAEHRYKTLALDAVRKGDLLTQEVRAGPDRRQAAFGRDVTGRPVGTGGPTAGLWDVPRMVVRAPARVTRTATADRRSRRVR